MEAHVLPVVGEIAAGGPIEAYQDASETVGIPDMLAPSGDAYVLKVRGDSMIEAHIADGDFVLIRPSRPRGTATSSSAQVEENAVTLKRFFKEKDKIRLQPANAAYPPMFYDDVRIQGKLIGGDSAASTDALRAPHLATREARSRPRPQGFHRRPTGAGNSVDEVRGQVPIGHIGRP
jgi:SOS-response transcriptional repressor LexA